MFPSPILHSIKGEIKENLSISIPLIAAQLVYASSGFIGTAMVAHLGEKALAASVLVSMIWMSLSVLFFGTLNSISVLVSHQYGANNYKGISEIMGQSFLFGAIMMIVMLLLLSSMPLFLRFSTQPPAVLKLAIAYMHALLWTIPGLIILIICEQFLAGVNHAKMVLRISLLVVPIEIPLIYMLVFGKFGLPACGVAGIGYGFAITYSCTSIGLTLYLLQSKAFAHFAVFKQLHVIHIKLLKELTRVGLPMGFMNVIEVSTFAAATFYIGRFGTSMLAAHQIAFQYLSFIITLVFAMSQAVTVRVGHAVGRKDFSAIRLAIYVGMLLNFFCIFLLALALNLYPHFFLQLDMNVGDTTHTLLLHDASLLLGLSGVLLLFDNFRIIGIGALRGLKDTQFPMYTSFLSFWIIGLSAAYYFAFPLQLQAEGIWWGLILGIACGAVIVFLRLHYLLKRIDLSRLSQTH
jgi:MATE family multidrug resistance protein